MRRLKKHFRIEFIRQRFNSLKSRFYVILALSSNVFVKFIALRYRYASPGNVIRTQESNWHD